MTTTPDVYFDVEIKQCDITKPHEALISDFSKKLIAHVSQKSKFKETYITDIVNTLEDENKTLSTSEGSDFLQFMDENKGFFDEVIKRYKGHFPARVQSAVSIDSMDMTQEDHILYENGTYKSFDKIRKYVQTRIDGGSHVESSEKPSESIDPTTRSEIEAYSASNSNCLQGEELQKLRGLKYSRTRNSHGIVQHKIGDIQCTSMISEQYPYGKFTYGDLNNKLNDYSKGRDFDNLNKNDNYKKMLQLSGSVHQSLESHNTMIFGIMQQIADQLGLDVTIDLNFVDNSKNDTTTRLLLKGMRSIFGAKFVIPYKIDNKTGLVSSLDCFDSYCGVYRDNNLGLSNLASFSAIGSSLAA